MKIKASKSLGIGILCLVLGFIIFWTSRSHFINGPVSETVRSDSAKSVASNGIHSGNQQTLLPAGPEGWIELVEQLKRSNADQNRQLLVHFFETQLRSQPPLTAAQQLIQFLNSGKDASTGLKFQVGPKHTLDEWPTLRVAALDWLGLISPGEAANYAEKIFTQQNSADEYAIALRNFAFGKPEEKSTLSRHFLNLLENERWKAAPTAGYLEAFDVAVFLADGNLVEPLAANLVAKQNPSLRKASFMALDRMAQANLPGVLKETLINKSLAETPVVRAGILGRIDIRDADQKALLESYLLDSTVANEEITHFVKAFPNGSGVMVYGLLSENRVVPFAELAQQDQQALKQIREWLKDIRFEERHDALQKLELRLSEYVASAIRGGVLKPTQ